MHVLEIAMVISTIDWCLIFVNQYYNVLMEFLGEKLGQFVQAPPQLNIHSSLVTNRFKIGPFREVKRLQEVVGLSNEPKNIKIGPEMKEIWLKHCLDHISFISGLILMFLGSLESPTGPAG